MVKQTPEKNPLIPFEATKTRVVYNPMILKFYVIKANVVLIVLMLLPSTREKAQSCRESLVVESVHLQGFAPVVQRQ